MELTTLNPSTGEPAIGHIRAAFARGMHVVTANKGPIAHAYAALREEAARAGVGLRFESGVMDGAPVFNLWRNSMPGVKVLGFTGVLNSTSKVVIETMEQGGSFDAGLAQARRMGITEADGAFDVEGWDSAAKTAALANVLMDARTTPQEVSTRGITRLTPGARAGIAREGKTVRLMSRGRQTSGGMSLRVRAEVLDRERHTGVHAGNHQHDSVPYRSDGHVRNGVDRPASGADRLRRVQRSGEFALSGGRPIAPCPRGSGSPRPCGG